MAVQNIFNALLGQQRSVTDYLGEMDQADARRQQMQTNALLAQQELETGRQRNALAALQMDQMRAKAQQDAAAQAARQSALSSPGVDARALYSAGIPAKDIEFLAGAGNLGRQKVARTLEIAGPDGRPMQVQLDEFGQVVGSQMPKAVPLKMQDLGGRVVAVDEYGMKPGQSMDKTMTAGERDASARGWAGIKQSADQFGQRLAFDKQKDAREAAGGGQITEGERNASGYASRMVEATKLLDQFESKGRATYGTQVAGALPLVGASAQRSVMNADQQRYRQAQEDWVRAKLRKESGAVIGKDEMDAEISTYFPMPGDLPENVAQKRQAREVATRAMVTAAGRGIKSQGTAPGQVLKFDAQGNPVGN